MSDRSGADDRVRCERKGEEHSASRWMIERDSGGACLEGCDSSGGGEVRNVVTQRGPWRCRRNVSQR
jgi:hypothetical protein